MSSADDESKDAAEAGGDWVRLASAGSNEEASIIRSYLESNEISVFVQGENHRSMLGVVGAYIELYILVPEAQLETATKLMEEYGAAEEVADAPGTEGPFRDDFDDEEDEAAENEKAWLVSAEYKRRTRGARIAALMFPVGGGHLSVGAPVRGLILAALSVGGIVGAVTGNPAAIVLLFFSMLVDWASVPGAIKRKTSDKLAS